MDNVEQILQDSLSLRHFAKSYFDYLLGVVRQIDVDSISAFIAEMEDARQNGKTVFFIGNGGSAATAAHMVNDFGTNIKKRTKTDKPFRVLSLIENTAVISAVSNDSGYDKLFVNQLHVYYRPGDKLVAISASGNSPNVVAAAQWVKSQDGVVLSLVGFDGGKLKELSDVSIHVKTKKGEYGPVEDVHLLLGHLMSYWAQSRIKKEQSQEQKQWEQQRV